MPKFSLFRYGQIIKYGAYDLRAVLNAIGPHVQYRMRTIDANGSKGEFVSMIRDRVEINTDATQFRVRIDDNEWVYMNTQDVKGDLAKVRIRSIDSEEVTSEWVYSERANLKEI
jgi:hypothetical protein